MKKTNTVINSNVEEAPAREFKQAFLSIDGVSDLIARIVDSVYTAAEVD